MIDLDQMERGSEYPELADTYIIFICSFDPLGGNLQKYTVRSRIEETDEIEYNDGTTKIFLSAEGTDGDGISSELREFLKYVAGKENNSELAGRMEKAVAEAKRMEKWK